MNNDLEIEFKTDGIISLEYINSFIDKVNAAGIKEKAVGIKEKIVEFDDYLDIPVPDFKVVDTFKVTLNSLTDKVMVKFIAVGFPELKEVIKDEDWYNGER